MSREFTAASSQYLEKQTITLAAGTACTVSMWAYPYQTNLAMNSSIGGSAAGRVRNIQWTTAAVFRIGASTSGYAAGPANYTANEWQHFAGVWGSATSRIAYRNGAPGTESTDDYSIERSDSVTIGVLFAGGGYAQYFNGRLAHFAVYGGALSAGEIAALYGGGIGADPRTIRPDILLYYYPLLQTDGDVDWWGQQNLTAYNSPTYSQNAPVEMASGIWVPQISQAAPASIVPRIMHHRRLMGAA